MTFKKILFAAVGLFLFAGDVFSQGFIETGLFSNPEVEARYAEGPWKLKNSDTLELPFLDDFSKTYVYPDSTLWADNYVFVNNDFGLNPPTIGVATFDMLDEKGRIYEDASSSGFYADTLTSFPINTDYPGDTTIILSFWYQPKGVANNAPEAGDSLLLQFYSPVTGEWYKVWSAEGADVYYFKPVFIRLDSIFFGKRFQV